jgi:hypothetical protein
MTTTEQAADPCMEDPKRGRGHSARVKETSNMDGDPLHMLAVAAPAAALEMEMGN